MENVVVIMGSKSDQKVVEPAIEILRHFKIETGVYCISAHRAHQRLVNFIKKMNESGHTEVMIAAAGMSAALPGIIASLTTIPIIGLPISGKNLEGKDALYSMVQMPPGIPVATVGIDAAKNAGLLAVRIVANTHLGLGFQLQHYNEEMSEKNIEDNSKIHSYYSKLLSEKESDGNSQESSKPASAWDPEDMM